jgi:hypothetical protein
MMINVPLPFDVGCSSLKTGHDRCTIPEATSLKAMLKSTPRSGCLKVRAFDKEANRQAYVLVQVIEVHS